MREHDFETCPSYCQQPAIDQFINPVSHGFPHGFPHMFFFLHMFPSFSETPSLPPRLSASGGTSCTSCVSGTSGTSGPCRQCDPSCCSQSRSSCTTRRRSREIFSPEHIHLTCSEHLYIPPKVLKMPGKKNIWRLENLSFTWLIWSKFDRCAMEMKFGLHLLWFQVAACDHPHRAACLLLCFTEREREREKKK